MRQELTKAGIEPADREARWLIEAGTGRPWAELIAHPGSIESPEEQRTLQLTHRRTGGEPLQYVTGVTGWRHLELAVGPGVFIPRPETELVVDQALARLPEGAIAVDVGTGSGAIAVAIAQERPDADVWATEIAPPALAWAEKNVAAHAVDVHLVTGDLFEGLPSSLRRHIGVVVANPPYVRRDEADGLPADVVEHEPGIALFAGGDGLEVVRRLAWGAREWLREGGWLVFEIGATQGAQAAALVEEIGYLEVSVGLDHAGRERIVEGRR